MNQDTTSQLVCWAHLVCWFQGQAVSDWGGIGRVLAVVVADHACDKP